MALQDRYIVIKRADLRKVTSTSPDLKSNKEVQAEQFASEVRQLANKPPLECIVIESDWPEYLPALAALTRRIENEGRTAKPKPYVVLYATSRSELEDYVADAYRLGYQPTGGVVKSDSTWNQAMVYAPTVGMVVNVANTK